VGRVTVAGAALLAVASLIVSPSWVLASPSKATRAACTRGYSYAGFASREGVRGVAASITATELPTVASGHAAAWIGVGGVHEGLDGANEWLQAGIAAFPKTGLRLYVEEVSRGFPRRFVDVGPASRGHSYRIQVVEEARDLWLASIGGRVVGGPAYLPTGGGSWRAVTTTESWAAGRSTCNRYSYRFDRLSVFSGVSWQTPAGSDRLGAPAARVTGGAAGFSAAS
jgi:hypothetical protein